MGIQIIINDTANLSDEDRQVLAVLAGTTVALKADAPTPVEEPKPAPKAKPKKTSKPAPAPAPEPEVEDEEDEDVLGDDSAAPTLNDAVARATELVSAGEAPRVKAALAELGAKRVSELKGTEAFASFLASLED